MENILPKINPEQEKQRIVSFLKKTFTEQGLDRAIIGLSGGIDSTVSFYLVKEVLPTEHIFVSHLYVDEPAFPLFHELLDRYTIPQENRVHQSITSTIEEIAKMQQVGNDKVRRGNIAARIRMIVLFDLAKKYNALVCGTENKSENLLGYFTRFGDQASDIEPIEHLYKTHVYQLAKHLGVPQEIIEQHPSANLWGGQTDEGEFGFTYQEADMVLYLALEKGLSLTELEKDGYLNAKQILAWRKKNLFKHNTPYTL